MGFIGAEEDASVAENFDVASETFCRQFEFF